MKRLQSLLAEIGLEAERVRMFNLSSAMGGAFAAAATEMTEQVAALGPSPLRLRLDSENPHAGRAIRLGMPHDLAGDEVAAEALSPEEISSGQRFSKEEG